MRQIWEKETKLTKEEVHERLEKYFTDNKYINATDEMGVLLCNASMKNRYFQIFYKEGIIRIEGWVKKGKNEQTTSDKKKDILGTDMQAFSRMFSDDGGAERSFEEENGNHAGYEMQLYLGLPKEQPRLAWVGLILAIIADFLGNARAWFVLSVVLAVVALYCSVKGSRSFKQSVAVLGMVVSMVFLLRVVKIIIMILMF